MEKIIRNIENIYLHFYKIINYIYFGKLNINKIINNIIQIVVVVIIILGMIIIVVE